eukprot:11176858-Lingulodinium_polyedra.AAC.1
MGPSPAQQTAKWHGSEPSAMDPQGRLRSLNIWITRDSIESAILVQKVQGVVCEGEADTASAPD